MANRSQKARILRNRRRGKFRTWKNNPKGGTQAPLRAYSMKKYTTPSQDIELWHGQTLGKRAKAAQNTVRVPVKGEMARKVNDIPIPPTRGLTFARVINPEEGPIPRLIVLDMLTQVNKGALAWFESHQYEEWTREFHRIALRDVSDLYRAEIFFKDNQYVVVEATPMFVRRSVIFRDFATARRRWKRQQVRWVETITL